MGPDTEERASTPPVIEQNAGTNAADEDYKKSYKAAVEEAYADSLIMVNALPVDQRQAYRERMDRFYALNKDGPPASTTRPRYSASKAGKW